MTAMTLHARGLIHRWRDRLPVNDATPEISLGEGNSPLVELRGQLEARELAQMQALPSVIVPIVRIRKEELS
jgi:hypothetical protein